MENEVKLNGMRMEITVSQFHVSSFKQTGP